MPEPKSCSRCGRRWRGEDGWNTEDVAGIEIGVLCPDCQTTEEDLDAELNLTLGRSTVAETLVVHGPEDVTDEVMTRIVERLVAAYPTPETMRQKASRLAEAKDDHYWMVGLMRAIADDMDSG